MPNTMNGPDPAIHDAIHRLTRTELSPLEEAMFQAWSSANQVEDGDNAENGVDLRNIYKQTGGKVLPPGQLKGHVEKAGDIQTLMKAQEAHDQASPIKAMMDAGMNGIPQLGSFPSNPSEDMSGFSGGASIPSAGGPPSPDTGAFSPSNPY